MQVHSQMKMCDNIDETLVNQELSDVLCEGTSKRCNKLVDGADCSSIQEMAWQSETQEVTENGYNSSLKDENCHISENVSLAIEPINELFLTNENFQLQNVGTPLKHTQMPPKEVDNIFDNNKCCPGRTQTEETPRMSDVCDSNANVEGNAQRHALSHTEQQSFNCGECGACFAEAGCLENHLRKYAQELIHICDVCGAAFAQPNRLIYYKRNHRGEKPYTCDVCVASFDRSSSLTVHKRTHTGEKPYKCDVCEASFALSGNLTVHKRTHTGEKPYKCDVCEASFAHSSSLTVHKRSHTGEKPYKCDVCEASFAHSSRLTVHKRTHMGEKLYTCDVCEASFARSRSLTIHKRTHTEKHPSSQSDPSVPMQVHSQIKMCDNIDEKLMNQELSDVLCEATSQRFNKLVDGADCSTIQEMAWQSETQEVTENGYNSSLKDQKCHMSENVYSAIEPNNELFLTNEKCQLQNVGTPLKRTQRPAKAVDNISGNDNCCPGRIQTEETPYMTDDCVSDANVEGNAQGHALSHTEQQSFNCGECGACFDDAGCLENHLRKHAEEGIHICDVCGAAFAQPYRLICHKRKHTGEKPYKCDVCEASFAHSGNLTVHKRTHTGVKPYKCDLCEASFIQIGSPNHNK
ncbi:hypothetical protein BsWGS_13466 [Bradybaena similaris]